MAEDELVVAATFTSLAEAKLAQALLETDGIESYLIEHTLGVEPIRQSLGGFKVMVTASSLSRAQELLSVRVSEEELAAEAEAAMPRDKERRE